MIQYDIQQISFMTRFMLTGVDRLLMFGFAYVYFYMCIFVKQIENHGVLTVSAWWFQVEDSTWLCQPQGTVDFFSGFNMVDFIYLHKNIVLVGVENLPVIARDENNMLWLVVYLPLWKIRKSVRMMKLPTYGNSKKSCSKPTNTKIPNQNWGSQLMHWNMGIVISKGPDGGENGVASLVFLGFPQKLKIPRHHTSHDHLSGKKQGDSGIPHFNKTQQNSNIQNIRKNEVLMIR